ncbi:MAG: helix-turn-helix domain-containing protein [Rikenellaceae bacterium]
MTKYVKIKESYLTHLNERLEQVHKRIEKQFRFNDVNRLEGWLDSHDVCMALNISPRKLQSLRYNGKLAFSQIGNKIYFQENDVAKLLTAEPNEKGGKK